MPGGTSQRHLLFTGCRCTACCLFMSVTFTAIHCCKSNQQHREQIGHDVKICLFPLAGLSVCQSYIHLYVSVFLCMFRPISSSFMPTQTLPIPNLAPEFLPTPTLSAYSVCIHDATELQHVKPLASPGWLQDGNWSPADYEYVKLAECISVTPITITFTLTGQLSR